MRLKLLLLSAAAMFLSAGCFDANRDKEYYLHFKIYDGERFITNGTVFIENANGEIFVEKINEYGAARFNRPLDEKNLKVSLLSGGVFYFFGQVDVSRFEINDGMRLVFLDISMAPKEDHEDLGVHPHGDAI